MNFEQASTTGALRSIGDFLDQHPEFASLKDSQARQNIDAARVQLETLGATQADSTTNGKVETVSQRNARLALRKYHMEGIAHAAKQTLANSPDLTQLTMPKGKVTAEQLLAAADGMSKSAKAHEQDLIAGGLPADFVAQLDAAIAALRDAMNAKKTQNVAKTGATAALKVAETQARTAIKVMNTIVLRMIPANNAGLKAAWNAAKKIATKPGLARGAIAGAALANVATQLAAKASTPATTSAPTSATTPTNTQPAA